MRHTLGLCFLAFASAMAADAPPAAVLVDVPLYRACRQVPPQAPAVLCGLIPATAPGTEPVLLGLLASQAETTGFRYSVRGTNQVGAFAVDGYVARQVRDGYSYAVVNVGVVKSASISFAEVRDVAPATVVEQGSL